MHGMPTPPIRLLSPAYSALRGLDASSSLSVKIDQLDSESSSLYAGRSLRIALHDVGNELYLCDHSVIAISLHRILSELNRQ